MLNSKADFLMMNLCAVLNQQTKFCFRKNNFHQILMIKHNKMDPANNFSELLIFGSCTDQGLLQMFSSDHCLLQAFASITDLGNVIVLLRWCMLQATFLALLLT